MSLQSTQRKKRQIYTDKQFTATTLNTNNSLTFSQTIQDADQVKKLYCKQKQLVESQKQNETILFHYKQVVKAKKTDACSVVFNRLTQKQTDCMVKALKMISFLARQAAEKKLLITAKQNVIYQLRKRIKMAEENIKIQSHRFEQKTKSFRERSESVKKSKRRNMKRLSTQISTMKQEINSIKRKLSYHKQSKNERIASKRSTLRNYTQHCQSTIFIPLTLPINNPIYRPSPFYQQIYQYQSPIPQNPLFKRTSQGNKLNYQPKTSQRSSQPAKQRQTPNRNLFDILGQKLQIIQSSNYLAVPFSQTEGLKGIKSQESKNICIKNSISKRSIIFDQSSVKIFCQQTNSYSLQQSHVKISSLEESIVSKYTATERANILHVGKQKTRANKSVRFHDSVQVESDMNSDNIVLASKSKLSKDSNYLPSSLQHSRRVDSQGSGFGQLHLTLQSIAPATRQAQHMRQSSSTKIIQ